MREADLVLVACEPLRLMLGALFGLGRALIVGLERDLQFGAAEMILCGEAWRRSAKR
jgi:hypothetical protein